VITACLVTVACLAGYGWLRKAAAPHAAPKHAVQTAAVADYGLTFEGFSWGWPEHLAAIAMFQCAPPASKDNRASVVVWTDKVNHVIAFGPAQEGVPMPAYATALSVAGAVDASQSIHVAGTGHAMRTSKKKNTLQLNDVKLDCVRNWDD
jgi:hypothetical protein